MVNPDINWAQQPLDVVAIGGNSLIPDATHLSVSDQYRRASETARHLTALVKDNARVLITHGNGPQVGFILLRSELAERTLHPVPLESCVADTQGAIGYQLQQVLENELRKSGIDRPVATLITRAEVRADDPACNHPTKPIGPWMERQVAKRHQKEQGWTVVEDSGRGWRRIVASPAPISVPETEAIRSLLNAGYVVIAAGGGGIPVSRNEQGELSGIAAVVDKDLTSSLLARSLDAHRLIITTGIDKVALNFGTPQAQELETITVQEATDYLAQGQFPPGSMGPKILAALQFIQNHTNRQALITRPDSLEQALAGQAGTVITA